MKKLQGNMFSLNKGPENGVLTTEKKKTFFNLLDYTSVKQ